MCVWLLILFIYLFFFVSVFIVVVYLLSHECIQAFKIPYTCFCLFVLRFYSPINPVGSCRVRSVYLTTLLLGRLSPLSGYPVLCTFFR